MSELRYSVYVTPMQPIAESAGLTPPDGSVGAWSPMASTLVHGPTEALLVDPPVTRAQGAAVADWAAGFGVPVSTIYVTHAHGDHWFSAGTILDRFPGARVVATEEVVAAMHRLTPNGRRAPFWDDILPGQLGDTPVLAEPATELAVDGQPVVPIGVGHSDTDPSTVLHVPALDLVIAGDVVYNRVHQYLAESADGGIDAWFAAIDKVAALAPKVVVASHQDASRGDAPTAIDDTRRYLEAAAALLDAQPSRREYFDRLVTRFPAWLNPTIAWLSAIRRLPA